MSKQKVISVVNYTAGWEEIVNGLCCQWIIAISYCTFTIVCHYSVNEYILFVIIIIIVTNSKQVIQFLCAYLRQYTYNVTHSWTCLDYYVSNANGHSFLPLYNMFVWVGVSESEVYDLQMKLTSEH